MVGVSSLAERSHRIPESPELTNGAELRRGQNEGGEELGKEGEEEGKDCSVKEHW